MTAGSPLTVKPFANKFKVEVMEPYGIDYAFASLSWYVPVVGSIAKDNPNFYPIPADPNMIFMVIRDPPGGRSSTTFHAGTSMSVTLSVDDMETYEHNAESSGMGGAGPTYEEKFIVMEKIFEFAKTESLFAGKGSNSMTGSIERSSNARFGYTFAFTYDISTSDDPTIAGHPSDIIIGGGIDLVVNEALKVQTTSKIIEHSICLYLNQTSQWQPGKLSTFILPVVEIKDILLRLQKKYNVLLAQGEYGAAAELKVQIDNWKKVLSDYRTHNSDLSTAMFAADNKLFKTMAAASNSWTSAKRSSFESKYRALVSFHKQYASGFKTVVSEVIDDYKFINEQCSADTRYVRKVCEDFQKNFKHFTNTIENACDQLLYDSENVNGFTELDKKDEDIAAIHTMCKTLSFEQPDKSYIGLDEVQSSTALSMFGFLNTNRQYVTFSAKAPVSIGYASKLSDGNSLSFSYGVSTAMMSGKIASVSTEWLIAKVTAKSELDFGHSRGGSVDKSTDQSKTFDRSVTINFADDDLGDFFVVQMSEDPTYGTPIFITTGGQSMCPGETTTLRREDRVTIHEIKHRCGPNKNELCLNLAPGEKAVFSVMILNLSPTEDAVTYGIGLDSSFDEYDFTKDNGQYECGTSGRRSGLIATFASNEITDIPWNTLIEVPFSVSNADFDLCNEYNDISLSIYSLCEEGGIQYFSDKGSIDYDNTLSALVSSTTFSVSWDSSRRLLGVNEQSLEVSAMQEQMKTMEMQLDEAVTITSRMEFQSALLLVGMVGIIAMSLLQMFLNQREKRIIYVERLQQQIA